MIIYVFGIVCSKSQKKHSGRTHSRLCFKCRININKKVLLRERKRHTAHHVASTPYVVLTGYPPPDLAGGGVPDLGTPQGTPLPGYPPTRVPPHQGTPPRLDLVGYPPPQWLAHGILGNVPKHYGIWDEYPPPPVDN